MRTDDRFCRVLAEIDTVPFLTEVDMTDVVSQREALKGEFETKHHIRPTYTHFLLWAISRAMMTERQVIVSWSSPTVNVGGAEAS